MAAPSKAFCRECGHQLSCHSSVWWQADFGPAQHDCSRCRRFSSADIGNTHSMLFKSYNTAPGGRSQAACKCPSGSHRTQPAAWQVRSTQRRQLQWGLGQHADCSTNRQLEVGPVQSAHCCCREHLCEGAECSRPACCYKHQAEGGTRAELCCRVLPWTSSKAPEAPAAASSPLPVGDVSVADSLQPVAPRTSLARGVVEGGHLGP